MHSGLLGGVRWTFIIVFNSPVLTKDETLVNKYFKYVHLVSRCARQDKGTLWIIGFNQHSQLLFKL